MRVISFDVGIENMAYCIFNVEENYPLKIVEWKTINLMNEEDIIKPASIICSCNNKQKKGVTGKCSRHALYIKSLNTTTLGATPSPPVRYFCNKHAKETIEYIIPDKSQQHASLNKLTIEQLIELCQKYTITVSTNDQTKRKKLVETLVAFFKERCFEPIKQKKQKNSKETNLISIGHNMRRELNNIHDFDSITNVIIENQISTLAARMNSIQGMLVQYFIMRMGDKLINIDFISSSNKLKGLPPIDDEKKKTILSKKKSPVLTIASRNPDNYSDNHSNIEEVFTETPRKKSVNSKYRDHKILGIYHCSSFLEHNPELGQQWKHVLDTKKKDDYADCFLQGIWYIKNHGLFKENTNYNLY